MNNTSDIKTKIVSVPYYLSSAHEHFGCPRFPPLGMAVITSYLRQRGLYIEQDDLNIKVHHDNYHKRDSVNLKIFQNEERVLSYLKNGKDKKLERNIVKLMKKTSFDGFDIIFLTVNTPTIVSLMIALSMANILKKNKNIFIGVGGSSQASAVELVKRGGKLKLIDFGIIGPGEIPSYELIMALKNKKPFHNIRGLIFYRDGRLMDNGREKSINPTVPDFSGLPLEYYRWKPTEKILKKHFKEDSDEEILMLPYKFIVGCPYNCVFCWQSSSTLIAKNPKEVADDLETLSKKHNTKYFYFLNNTLNISNKFINELCDEIINRNLNIYWCDSAVLKNLDKKTLKKMRKAGCISLIFGLETGSPRLLKYIEKGVTPNLASDALRWCNEAGIWTGLNIICGLPTETEEDIDKTIDFLNKNQRYIDNVYFHRFYFIKISKLGKFPNRYGIKNIKKIKPLLKWNTVINYGFDEINGLKWEDKIKQIEHSYHKTRYSSNIKESILHYDQILLLFKLYSIFNDKPRIKKTYLDIAGKIYRKNLFKHSFIIKNIRGLSSFQEIKKKVYSLTR